MTKRYKGSFMNFQLELQFLLDFFKNHKINTYFYHKETDISSMDLHLRQILGCEQDYSQITTSMLNRRMSNTIFKIIDQFHCVYYFMELPTESSDCLLIIGPYQQTHPNPDTLYHYVESYSVSPHTFQQLMEVFAQIPVLLDDTSIQTLLQTFGETLWGGKQNFEFQILDQNLEEFSYSMLPGSTDFESHGHFDIQFIESYLVQENALIQAVNQGQTQTAEELLSSISTFPLADTTPEMLRNMKNYAIMLNTIFRKTAEFNNVNPHQLVSTSAKFFKKIELCPSPDAISVLLREMVRKYCLLAKNHTMKEYSLLIQQTIQQIDMDLTADLSLHAMAKKLNSNASYLSTQFKKVTGTTYTEYVQRKRIEHSIFLLNTTSLQIQTIAQYCGIPDLNYFSKLFKKYVNYSPSAYRKEISRHDA